MLSRTLIVASVIGLAAILTSAHGQPGEKKPGGAVSYPRARPDVPQEVLEQAREAVELAEAELELKRAHVASAHIGVKSAERQARLAVSAGAAVSETERQLLSFSHERAVAELRIKEAEMKIGEIKLQHARRKLARLEPSPKPKEDKQ